ncbi:hypothetical protein DRE_00795 [Drechslerella stenobrocha 248]|uniref:LYC1 C-terminal domain-containing protein n=1 Tax=Drechslerella stenobrocha 248 TaxID=1043628 RepID=W7HMY7_9PEZI|nr:hypothetical protein DRE_00795 [Drechslerella stenobrocha 248]
MAPSTTCPSSPAVYSAPSSPLDTKHPHLILRPATIPERHHTWVINSPSWRGILTENAYYLREAHLSAQDLTRNGGITYWVLVDPSTACDPSCPQSPDHILSACEAIRKPSIIVRKNGEIEDVISYGIGGVYTASPHRGKGYARTMMQLLGHQLRTLPDPSDPKKAHLRVGFSVLYSDIGKDFYKKVGWRPHDSSHISFPAQLPSSAPSAAQAVKKIAKADLKAMCAADCIHIRRVASKTAFKQGVEARCVQLPTVEVIDWHHAREEFVGQYATTKAPTVKGAWAPIAQGAEFPPKAGSEGLDAVWVIWMHDFATNKLIFLRLHVPPVTSANIDAVQSAMKALMVAAVEEALAWGFKELISWNPDDVTEEAVKSVFGKESYNLVHRENDSIASLMWYDHGEEIEPEGVEWLVNEKSGWC